MKTTHIFKTAVTLYLCIAGVSLHQFGFAADDDRNSRENADSAKDSHETGSGRSIDCGGCDWNNRDKDNNLPNNEQSSNEGLHTPSWDRRD